MGIASLHPSYELQTADYAFGWFAQRDPPYQKKVIGLSVSPKGPCGR
jgi:hypothetical protein